MNENNRRERYFPIGIQTFEKIRELNAIYIDKTEYIYNLVQNGQVYFLSRPRRFGKSLLISTMEAYFQGKKELFEGFAISKLEKEWIQYPVFRFDLSGAKYRDVGFLTEHLDLMLEEYENIYGRKPNENNPSSRMNGLIRRAWEKTGRPVVILIDEYDAPLLDTLVDNDTFKTLRNMLRDFYSPLKSCDAHLKFVFLTGITKFSQLSIFSELNNLNVISMDDKYAGICGITKEELLTELKPEIQNMADYQHITFDETVAQLKHWYDGYHFTKNCPDIYNPFSLLLALSKKEVGNYWFSTGTPTHLTEMVSQYILKPEELEGFPASEMMFNVPTETAETPIPVLYQSGYVTIKEYDDGDYILGFPNEEVRVGFLRLLMPYYAKTKVNDNEVFLLNLTRALKKRDVEKAMQLLQAFLASVPYDAEKQDENHYKTMFYLIFKLATAFQVRTEERTASGRIDALLETKDTVYLFEFKLKGTAQAAMDQINSKGYMTPYQAGNKKVIKVGAAFDDDHRTLKDWVVE